jgi:AAA+ superfamily predicted ATPase
VGHWDYQAIELFPDEAPTQVFVSFANGHGFHENAVFVFADIRWLHIGWSDANAVAYRALVAFCQQTGRRWITSYATDAQAFIDAIYFGDYPEREQRLRAVFGPPDTERTEVVRDRRTVKETAEPLTSDEIIGGNAGDSRLETRNARACACHRATVPISTSVAQHHTVSTQQRHESRSDSQGLYVELTPRKQFRDLMLAHVTRKACEELVEEQRQAQRLRQYGLLPRHRILLSGVPGTGKTTLAEAFATEMELPFCKVLYHRVIGEQFGDTIARLWQVFDVVREFPCVLFFDEFETLAKERGDRTDETGLQRAVSTLLTQIDDVPWSVVLIAATNHLELMDSAAWRRFQLRLDLPKPSFEQVCAWLTHLSADLPFPARYSVERLAEHLRNPSWGELEEFTLGVRRRYVLAGTTASVENILEERLQQYNTRFVSAY